MSLHKNLGPIDIHVPYAFVYANSADRISATGLTSNDIGKFARQLDDNSLWMLTDTLPTWNSVVGGSSVTPATHKSLRQLIHLADGDGPFEGFASGVYNETVGGAFPTSMTWYTDNTKTNKIVEKTITRNSSNIPTSIIWKAYDVDGVTVLATVTDTITYVNNVFEVSRTRTIA